MTPLSASKNKKEALRNKADSLREKKSFKEAISTYLNSVLIDRNNAETYLGLGICYKSLGKINKAIEYLEKAALLDRDKFETFF